ncbi:MAG: UbiD family decarboxylase [Rhodospirillales bacterium]|jgi:4-hydroxy-3-polyprenylbenzoate decarboxylase|nr:UbiD family decarboxylase [Rhodospirillales bacterium]MBT4007204.1 UbiD family decarboxylase [Rhodospirillales bacterium]MBT5075971.1 UbiD family decarboxylase [Rhodospirillales bacterium]MBT5113537.1 UbiD family decarboxylase [Rhodospirillales bacterium]MBT5673835.1 UbiD family decarboxylase [Rhodospirillales bacterium]
MTKDITNLRSTLEWLKSEGDLIETDKEVNPDLEITGLQKQFDGGPCMLFNNVKTKPNARAVTNLFGDIKVIEKMFGWSDSEERVKKVGWAIDHPTECVEISQEDAPCQEHVITENIKPNDWLTAIRHTELETELTIGSGISCVMGEYFDGGSHIGYNRMNFRWDEVGTLQISPGSHMWQIMTEHYHDDKPIPMTMCFGVPPAVTYMAGAGFDYAMLPKGCDEVGMAGTIQGSPVRKVKCRTIDAYTLADAEYVLEGYLHPRDKRYETKESEDADQQGKYFFHPEWAGYMGKAYKAPTFHVTALTMRKPESKPIIFPLGVHTADDANIDTSVRESAIYNLCDRLQPGVCTNVHIPYAMTDWGGAIIQVKKRNKIEEGWQRNFLTAVLACSQGARLVIAVSEDVDIYDMDDIMWCLTTRVNPQMDILNPHPGGIGQTFMPAERMTAGAGQQWTAANTVFEGGMGIDATVPYGYEQDFHRPVYPVDKVNAKDFFTDDQIENMKSRMQGWVLSLARTGR